MPKYLIITNHGAMQCIEADSPPKATKKAAASDLHNGRYTDGHYIVFGEPLGVFKTTCEKVSVGEIITPGENINDGIEIGIKYDIAVEQVNKHYDTTQTN